MKLPDYERVIYQRNPLVEVACQIRFPTILKISNQEPFEFQDRIRFNYPLYEVQKYVSIPGIQNDLVQLAQKAGLALNFQDTTYNFKSESLKWQLSLNKDFIALATIEYERYEAFKERFKEILYVFEQIYQPSFYSRIDLKYQDLIMRSNLNIEPEPTWADLIPARIASELHTPEISESIKTFIKNWEVDITDTGKLQFKHGLVMAQDPEKGTREPAYLLDADFFTEAVTRRENVWDILDQFKESAGRLFRWSITEQLHLAMEPKPIYPDD